MIASIWPRKKRDCKHIWSVLGLRLQAPYLVPFETQIASILGPHHNNYCNYMWSIPISSIWIMVWATLEQYRAGSLMIAIVFMMGNNYDCNPNNREDQIWLQPFLIGTKYDCNHIWSDSELRLQSSLGPFKIIIAFIFGPLRIIAITSGPPYRISL